MIKRKAIRNTDSLFGGVASDCAFMLARDVWICVCLCLNFVFIIIIIIIIKCLSSMAVGLLNRQEGNHHYLMQCQNSN